MKFPYNEFITSAAVRGAQLLLAIINLGLSAKLVSNVAWDRFNFSLAVSILTLVYLAIVLIPTTLAFVPPLSLLITEGVFWIFWLSQFAAMADAYGSVDCGVFFYVVGEDTCKISKATIAMGVLEWILFSLSLVSVILYVIRPLGSYNTSYVSTSNDYVFGGMFGNNAAAVNTTNPPVLEEDIENKAESVDSPLDETAPVAAGSSLDPAAPVEPPVAEAKI